MLIFFCSVNARVLLTISMQLAEVVFVEVVGKLRAWYFSRPVIIHVMRCQGIPIIEIYQDIFVAVQIWGHTLQMNGSYSCPV